MRRKTQVYLLSLVFGLVSQAAIATAIDVGSNSGISTPVINHVTATSSQITWTTGVATTMNYLSYGVTSGTYSNSVYIPCDQSVTSQTPTTSHCVNLINLLPNTTYYYKIPSNTASSASGSGSQVASVNNTGFEGSFKTLILSTNTLAQPLGPPYLVTPSSVLATTTLANPTLVNITWVNSPSNTTQTRFEITKATLGGSPITLSSSISASARSFTDTVTVAGVYVYGVKSCTEEVCSSVATSVVNISMPSIPLPRSATLSGSSTVQLIWSDTSWNETRFEIYRGGVNIAKVDPDTTSYTDTVSTPGTYEYTIVACNIFGCSYPQARFTPAIVIAAPSSTPIPLPTLSGSFIPATIKPDTSSVFSYSVENARYCQVINAKGDTLFTSTSTSFSSTFSAANYPLGLTAVVTCYNAAGLSTSITKTLTVSTTTPSSLVLPGQPTNAYSVVISTSSARLYWGDTQNETMYRILRTPTGDATPPTVNADTVTYLDTNLLPGVTYTYSVQACNTAAGTLTLNCSGAVNAGIISTPKLPVITPASSTLPIASSTAATTTVPVTGISFGDVPAATSLPPKDTVVTPPVTVTTPSTPLSLVATRLSVGGVLTNSIHISWKSASTNTLNFKLYRSSSNNSLQLPSPDVNTTFFDDVSLPSGSYSYYLSACNEKGCSATVNTAIIIIPEIKVEEATPADTLLSLEISKAVGPVAPSTFINIVPTLETATKLGSSRTFTSTASADGFFSVKVPDGVYTVEGITPVKVVTLVLGKVTATTDKVIPKNKIITGVVTLLDGTPVINAEVSAYKKETNEWLTTSTNSSGNYSITTSGGVWDVTVKPKDSQTVLWEAVNVLVTAGFSNQDSSETQVANLRVIPFGSNLTVTVRDENNNVVPSLLVTLDTSSSMSSQTDTTTQVTRKILSQKTAADGSVTIHVPGGKYFIRVLVPTGFGYSQPDETSVMLTPNENREVPIVLTQESIIKTSKLTGVTKFDDGTPTDAFVSAWSNEGGKAEVKTSSDGKFSLDVAIDQTWHIKAIKDLLQKSYISSEQTIVSTAAAKSLDLVFVKNDATPLPTTVTAQKSATEVISLSSDNGARFTLPANGVTSSGKVDITIKPTTEAPSRSASTLVSTAYDITIKNAQGQKLSVLASDAEIIIPYDEKELAAKGVAVESVIPSYYDETLATWISVPKFIINKEKKVFILRVNHLTRFALIALADTTAPIAPTDILAEEIVSAGIKLTWKNPTQDFNHSKVYRSEKLGSSGDLVAAEVFSNSFLDKVSIAGGKIYYYTVRAVDAAGNESSNSNQLAYSAQGSSLAVGTSTTLLLPPGQVSSGLISRQLSLGSTGEDVTALQKALKYDGFYATGPITGYYGKLTQNAVFRFQNYYKAELLIPNGYKKGTGIVGAITAKKINEIIAQETQ